jgi:hypothetical protein
VLANRLNRGAPTPNAIGIKPTLALGITLAKHLVSAARFDFAGSAGTLNAKFSDCF